MPKPVRLAYIGAGGFTNAYMYPQLKLHDIELVAVCDLVEEKAQLAARQYGFERVYTDFFQMLEETQPEAVICVGGPKVHYAVGKEVLLAGFPLYVQKSPAPSAAQTQEMANIAAGKGVVFHVGFNLRRSRAVSRTQEIVAGEEFGPTTLVSLRYGLVNGATMRDAVLDQHCHGFDTLRRLGGEVTDMVIRPLQVAGHRGYAGVVTFESGAVGTIGFTPGQIIDREFFYFEVTGTNGHMITSHDFDLTYSQRGGPDEVHRLGNFAGAAACLRWLGYVDDVAGFLAAVRGDAPDPSPGSDAVATMKLCEQAYAAVSSFD
ncbi:MAG: Gfo/Idh/MocA family oxidoreductase [Armatimonadia bacterium]